MRTVSVKRKFDGKVFTRHGEYYLSKYTADTAAKILRMHGYQVRVTFRPKSKRRGGYPLMDLWYVWKRRD